MVEHAVAVTGNIHSDTQTKNLYSARENVSHASFSTAGENSLRGQFSHATR